MNEPTQVLNTVNEREPHQGTPFQKFRTLNREKTGHMQNLRNQICSPDQYCKLDVNETVPSKF